MSFSQMADSSVGISIVISNALFTHNFNVQKECEPRFCTLVVSSDFHR